MSVQTTPLTTNLEINLQRIQEALGNSSDLKINQLKIGRTGSIPIAVIFIDGLVDKDAIQDFIIKALIEETRKIDLESIKAEQACVDNIKSSVLLVESTEIVHDFEQLYTSVLSGNTVILINEHAQGIIANTKEYKDRGVTEPTTQTVIRGPRDSFSETLRTNTSLIRRRIKDPQLRLETKQIGRVTKTDVSIMYIKGIASDKVVAEVHKRLDRIDIDGILESGYIEELIQDETYTPFPTVYNTERPDVIAAGLLEGRIAILVDGTPFVLMVPSLFIQFFQSAEDYYQRADISSLLRMLRLMAFMISLIGPSAYIAISTFHQEMIPTRLLLSFAAYTQGVPFPAFVEALIMEVTFEILREAGVRMPRAIGQTMSIVGGLVIGQAVVQAGLISPAMVIVVSLTAIANFVIPSYNLAISIRMIRFLLMVFAASFGLYGILLCIIAMILHMCSLRSFGEPYMAPNAPFVAADQKDSILFRVPLWGMLTRPGYINQKNVRRANNKAENKLSRKSNSHLSEGDETS